MSEQIDRAIEWGRARCTDISETAKLDAELLLAHCIGKTRSYLYSWPEQLLKTEDWQRFQALIARRLEPTPIAYLLGEREFFSLRLKTSPAALVPRAETELLVETTLALCSKHADANLLELGTGTGAIAIALKVHCPTINIIATDISTDCLALAQQNADSHRLIIDWIASDWFSQVDGPFDLIVSNPPYIAAADPALKEGDLPAEPRLALSPGPTGLEALQNIIAAAPGYLNPGGYLLLEHGFDQQAEVETLMRNHGFINIDCKQDLQGLPRVSLGKVDSATPD
jgi:release factor glutamine methyltransferase